MTPTTADATEADIEVMLADRVDAVAALDLDAGTEATPAWAEAPPLPHQPSKILRLLVSTGYGILGFLVLGVVWHVVHLRADTLPGPLETLATLRELLGQAFVADSTSGKGIGLQLIDSLLRVARGFGMAVVVGVPFGLLIGTNRVAFRMFNPIVQLLRPVSPLAWFPIWLTILVKADPAAVWTIFITCIWPIVINTSAGALSVPSDQRDVARVFRMGRISQLRHIVVPHALPPIITGLRISMGVAWMVIIAAEMLSAASGVGFFVWSAYNGPGLKYVISAILLIGAVGVVLDLALVTIGKRLSPEVAR